MKNHLVRNLGSTSLGRGEDVYGLGDGLPEFCDGAGGPALEVGLELGEGHLDRVEVGAVGRQEAQLGSGSANGVTDSSAAVGGEVVHHHDVAGLEGRHQHLFDVGQEGGPMHGAVEHHGGRHPAQPQWADEGGGLPVSVRDRCPATVSARSSAAASRHLGGGAGLVDEDEPFRVESELGFEPRPPPPQHVNSPLLAGVSGFIYRLIPDPGAMSSLRLPPK